MTNFFGTGIFWITLAAVTAILSMATIIGRAWCSLLPRRFSAPARFYLAPALGLASLTIIASLVGRVLPLGNSIVVPWLVIALLVWALIREPHKNQVFSHTLMVSVFGIVCGVSMLAPLFTYGAFNAHNDAFTYLAHSNWLQQHAFGEIISAEQVTPLTTQISLYQLEGFRMGGSFLLAFIQALLNLQWSYEVYPGVIISAITACCLAIGFPLAQVLCPMRRPIRLAMLALPAFSLGGLVFGANYGFLPQTIGLALGGAFLFMVGTATRWATTTKATWQTIGKAALPGSALFAGATFAYSELAPFLLMAVVGSGFILVFRFHAWRKLLVYGGVLFGLSILLLNTELVRVYAALKTQTGAIVGTPVNWSLLGYVAHALGVHGGAWGVYQWTNPESVGSGVFAKGLILLGLVVGLVFAGIRPILRATLSGALMPVVIILAVFTIGFVYFRYFVPSPFPLGLGQSWSQFKLADWAHPFVMVLVLFSIANFRTIIGTKFNSALMAIFMMSAVSTTITGVARITPLMQYYNGVTDLNQFYLKFRKIVIDNCPASASIYMNLNARDHKFRQMAILYLHDRDVRSDWMDDIYIYTMLPAESRTEELTAGNCVVEREWQDGWLSKVMQVGPFIVGVNDGHGKIRIASVTGAYDRESDGQNWWHWVEQKVSFKLQPMFVPKDAAQTKLHFEYGTRGKQTLTLRIFKRDGSSQGILLQSKGDALLVFDKVIDFSPTELAEVSIETDGKASLLSDRDPRIAAWVVRNLDIQWQKMEAGK